MDGQLYIIVMTTRHWFIILSLYDLGIWWTWWTGGRVQFLNRHNRGRSAYVHLVLRNLVYGVISIIHRAKIGGQVGHGAFYWWTGGQCLGKLILWRDVHHVRQN